MGFVLNFLKVLFRIVTNTFFKEIKIVGLDNIPMDEPVIICVNHANQFVDGMLLYSVCSRSISFITAAVSLRKPIIGHFARAIGAIGVERPQDLAKAGTGKIETVDKDRLIGVGSKFTQEVKVGESIVFQKQEFIVKVVVSDTVIQFSGPEPEQLGKVDSTYKIVPKIDQSQMFEQVWESLKNKRCIGIFPEGGSHDRPDLLPLKAGVCIMALGAMAKYQCNVKILVCGLNYYQANKFRSKVVIEFGKPYDIPNELTELYKTNRRDAISVLLQEIEGRLRDVAITAPSYKVLNGIHATRKLYVTDDERLTPEQEVELNRRFAKGYQKFEGTPEVQKLLDHIIKYNNQLDNLGISDSDVKNLKRSFIEDFLQIVSSFMMLIFSGVIALPGVLLLGPFVMVLEYLSENERKKALANSKVKITGKDVVASFKIMTSIIIFPLSSMVFTTAFFLLFFFLDEHHYNIIIYTIIFFFCWPVYVLVAIRSFDGLKKHLICMFSYILTICDQSKINNLKLTRNQLKEKIREFVNQHGNEVVPNFDQNRVISSKVISQDRRQSIALDKIFTVLQEKGL